MSICFSSCASGGEGCRRCIARLEMEEAQILVTASKSLLKERDTCRSENGKKADANVNSAHASLVYTSGGGMLGMIRAKMHSA